MGMRLTDPDWEDPGDKGVVPKGGEKSQWLIARGVGVPVTLGVLGMSQDFLGS